MGQAGKKGLLVLGMVTAGLILGAGAALAARHGLLQEEKPQPSPIQPSAVQEEMELPPIEKDVVRVLACGIDDTLQLTDVLLYGVFNASEGTAKVLQIPRDSYIGSQYPTGKINAVYSHPVTEGSVNGMAELEAVVEEQLGLPVDYYATVTLSGFRSIIDDLGGVKTDVPQRIEYLPGKVLEAGVQTLTGEQAEWLVRFRKGYATGDIGRMNMQAAFLKSLMAAVKEKGRLNALNLLLRHYDLVKTNMPLSKMLSYAGEAYRLEPEDISFYMAPGRGVMNRSYAVYELDGEGLVEIINEGGFRPGEAPLTTADLNLQRVPPPPPPAEEEPAQPQEQEAGELWKEFFTSLQEEQQGGEEAPDQASAQEWKKQSEPAEEEVFEQWFSGLFE